MYNIHLTLLGYLNMPHMLTLYVEFRTNIKRGWFIQCKCKGRSILRRVIILGAQNHHLAWWFVLIPYHGLRLLKISITLAKIRLKKLLNAIIGRKCFSHMIGHDKTWRLDSSRTWDYMIGPSKVSEFSHNLVRRCRA